MLYVMATSCEPRRCSTYSDDLRWRMVYQRLALDFSCKRVATNLGVDPSTVSRTVQLFKRTGSVDKKHYDCSNLPRKLTDVVQFLILQLIMERPGIYLHELQTEIKRAVELDVAQSTLCQFLHTQGFSRQKMKLVAKQRDDVQRSTFANEVSIYSADMFIFLDETGTDRRDVLRRYAFSWRGRAAQAHKLLVRGEHLSAVACMSTRGALDCKVVHGPVDGDLFYEIVQGTLLPHLMPFNGTSVVIMDNASIHHVEGIQEMINGVGALLLYLPPYSPDYNPIEELFSKLKKTIKWYEREHDLGEMDMDAIVYAAYSHITEEDCQNWIDNSGIYNMN